MFVSVKYRVTRVNTLLFFFTVFLILNSACKKEPRIVRFIDEMGHESVHSSPLKNLEQKFERIEREWKGSEMFPYWVRGEKFWAVPTQRTVLSLDGSENPRGMEVYQKGKSKPVEWRLKKNIIPINPASYEGYKQEFQSIVLVKDEYFIGPKIFLPEGDVELNITARSRNIAKYAPLVEVYLDDIRKACFPVSDSREYRLIVKAHSGRQSLKIGFSKLLKQATYEGEEQLLVDKIVLEPTSDLILWPDSEENAVNTEENSFRAEYYAEPSYRTLVQGEGREKSSGFVLSDKKSWEQEIELEGGLNAVEVIGYAYPRGGVLSVWLDGERISREWVYPRAWRSYFFRIVARKGEHHLKLEYSEPNPPKDDASGSAFILHQILLYPPDYNKLMPLTELVQKAGEYALEDLGTEENPFFSKYKLPVEEYTLNAILAPPRSELVFSVKVPESGQLEFGHGILPGSHLQEKGIVFKVKIGINGQEKMLFSRTMHHEDYDENMPFSMERVSLAEFQGERAALHFITETDDEAVFHLSYWLNPVIYKAVEEKKTEYGKPPNIILISLDAVRADHLGCYGYERATSSNLDEFSGDSIIFQKCIAQAPYTITSHMSILTGLYPANHQVYSYYQKLHPSIITLADILRRKGYFTAAFTGGGQVSGAFGFTKGFDFYNERKGAIFSEKNLPVFSNLSIDWIRENKDKPFFLFLHTYQAHDPYSPPAPYNTMFTDRKARWKQVSMHRRLRKRVAKYRSFTKEQRDNIIALYDGEIRYIDEVFIKPLMESLKQLGLYERSLIIITSDHGQEFYEHGSWIHGHSLYNELIRVPLIVKLPHSRHSGKRVENIVRSVDIMPTILEEVGLDYSGFDLDGAALSRLIEGKEKSDRIFISEIKGFPNFPGKLSTNKDHYKVILNELRTDEEHAFFDPPPPPVDELEVFDLIKDFKESRNIAEQNKNLSAQLLEALLEYKKKAGGDKKKGRAAVIDKELEERLKALGYIR